MESIQKIFFREIDLVDFTSFLVWTFFRPTVWLNAKIYLHSIVIRFVASNNMNDKQVEYKMHDFKTNFVQRRCLCEVIAIFQSTIHSLKFTIDLVFVIASKLINTSNVHKLYKSLWLSMLCKMYDSLTSYTVLLKLGSQDHLKLFNLS